LEALLGQALTLDDEPTLVRAVKAVKRTIEKDQRLKRGYIGLAISVVAVVLMGLGIWLGGLRGGVVFGLTGLGCGLMTQRSLFMSAVSIVLSGILAVPVSGVMIPYHPAVLRIYQPGIQRSLQFLGVMMIIGVLVRNLFIIINLKREQWEKRRKEEEQRQQKLKGIFYTPAKQQKRAVSSGFPNTKGKLEFRKSQSMFALS